MVWFQCEDCGENLKKPKLQNHFRMCSANKLSCIDCGYTFNQQSVQGHTQCISEAEKYGLKGEVRGSTGSAAKEKTDTSQNCDVDLSAGLSTRPPWSCSLCNVKTTSRETLLLHSDGKKHKSKARAFQASNKSSQAVKPSQNGNVSGDKPGIVSYSKEEPNMANHQSKEKYKQVKVIDAFDGGDCTYHKTGKQEAAERPVIYDKKEESQPVNSPGVQEDKHSKKRKRKGDKSSSSYVVNVENQQNQAVQGEPDLSDGDMVQTRHLSVTKEGSASKKKKHDKIGLLDVSNGNNQLDQAGKSKGFNSQNGLENENGPRLDDAGQSKEMTGKKNKLSDLKFVEPAVDDKERETYNLQIREQSYDAVEDINGNAKEISKLPVKWKKLIKSVLKSSPDGALRMKKLQKAVVPLAMKALDAAGVSADESHVKNELIRRVHSSSRLIVERKTVRLA